MVSVEFIDKKNKLYRFRINNVDFTLLNYLRRTLNYCVPIYAIDEIEYIYNDSVINDEFLANRIGLCPISTPLDTTGKTVKFSLDVDGPITVYSKDLITTDPDIDLVYKNIPLTKLSKDQKLKLEGNAVLGQGRNHVKFSPAIVSYNQLINLKKLKGCDLCQDCVNACPKNILEIKNNKPYITDQYQCDACRACVDACSNNSLKMEYSDDFVFNIEIIGQINVKDLIKKAQRYTKDYLKLLKKKLK
jgi:DNA-directed RNA polymerase subunit D